MKKICLPKNCWTAWDGIPKTGWDKVKFDREYAEGEFEIWFHIENAMYEKPAGTYYPLSKLEDKPRKRFSLDHNKRRQKQILMVRPRRYYPNKMGWFSIKSKYANACKQEGIGNGKDMYYWDIADLNYETNPPEY